MKFYMKLIKKGRLLDEVIHDLREATYRYPVDVIIWQTLGGCLHACESLAGCSGCLHQSRGIAAVIYKNMPGRIWGIAAVIE